MFMRSFSGWMAARAGRDSLGNDVENCTSLSKLPSKYSYLALISVRLTALLVDVEPLFDPLLHPI